MSKYELLNWQILSPKGLISCWTAKVKGQSSLQHFTQLVNSFSTAFNSNVWLTELLCVIYDCGNSIEMTWFGGGCCDQSVSSRLRQSADLSVSGLDADWRWQRSLCLPLSLSNTALGSVLAPPAAGQPQGTDPHTNTLAYIHLLQTYPSLTCLHLKIPWFLS